MATDSSTGLPHELAPLVGRKAELEALSKLLAEQRFIVVTGMSGVGKTRLIFKLAESAQRAYRNNVHFIKVGSTGVKAELVESISEAVESPAEEGLTGIGRALKSRPTLILLDGADRLEADVGSVIEQLLRQSPELRIVVTSQQRTNILGERLFTLGPLTTPTHDYVDCYGPDGSIASEAVQLLVGRIRETTPDFQVTPENAEYIFAICRLTEGVPRAIEAAARAHYVLGTSGLAVALQERPLILEEFAPQGWWHKSTREAFKSSLEQLDNSAIGLYLNLAQFRSRFDIQFAAEVFGNGDASTIAATVASLVDHSLLVREMRDGEPLFGFVGLYRDLALEQLRTRGDGGSAAVRLRSALIRYLRSAGSEWYSDKQLSSVRFLNRYVADISYLLNDLSSSPSEARLALELICGLRYYWLLRPVLPWPRARDWLAAAMSSNPAQDTTRLRALQVDAYIAFYENDLDDAELQLKAAAKLATELQPEAKDFLFGVFIGGLIQMGRRNFAAAETAFSQLTSESTTGRHMRDQVGERYWFLAMARLAQGDLAGAETAVQEGLRWCEKNGDVWGRANTMWMLALMLLRGGDPASAILVLRQSIPVLVSYGDRTGLTLAAQLMATAAAEKGDQELADRIAVTKPVQTTVYPIMAIDEIDASRWDRSTKSVTETTLTSTYFPSSQFSIPDVIARVLDQVAGTSEGRVSSRPALERGDLLSSREFEIATLVAEGLGNPAIAARLVISRRTVEGHVQRILGKLGFRSRSQIAVWVSENRHSA